MKIYISIIAVSLIAILAHGEGRTPYAPILKSAIVKKVIEIDGDTFFRAYLKPKEPNIEINAVVIHLERNGEILETLTPQVRTINEDSLSKGHPWEILLPFGNQYGGDTELVHNQESGSIDFKLSFNISGNIFTGEKNINND
jgi:hypothetical protein